MGLAALDQASCDFPGIGQFDDPALHEPAPADPTQWQIARTTAVSKAESLIGRFNDDFGWAFVDKESPSAYRSKLLTAWGAQIRDHRHPVRADPGGHGPETAEVKAA